MIGLDRVVLNLGLFLGLLDLIEYRLRRLRFCQACFDVLDEHFHLGFASRVLFHCSPLMIQIQELGLLCTAFRTQLFVLRVQELELLLGIREQFTGLLKIGLVRLQRGPFLLTICIEHFRSFGRISDLRHIPGLHSRLYGFLGFLTLGYLGSTLYSCRCTFTQGVYAHGRTTACHCPCSGTPIHVICLDLIAFEVFLNGGLVAFGCKFTRATDDSTLSNTRRCAIHSQVGRAT